MTRDAMTRDAMTHEAKTDVILHSYSKVRTLSAVGFNHVCTTLLNMILKKLCSLTPYTQIIQTVYMLSTRTIHH